MIERSSHSCQCSSLSSSYRLRGRVVILLTTPYSERRCPSHESSVPWVAAARRQTSIATRRCALPVAGPQRAGDALRIGQVERALVHTTLSRTFLVHSDQAAQH